MAKILTTKVRRALKNEHRCHHEKCTADRIKAILMYDDGFQVGFIAKVLMLNESGIHRYVKRFEGESLEEFVEERFSGGLGYLNDSEMKSLEVHLCENTYHDAKGIVAYVKKRYGVSYSQSGMTELLHKMGFVYKKSRQVPCKADAAKQQAFVNETYAEIKRKKGPQDKIYFVDATHPVHNSMACYGWVK